MPSDEQVRRGVQQALADRFGRVEVRLGARLPGSERSVVRRADVHAADRTSRAVVIKAAVDTGDGSVREHSALALASQLHLPGVVPLLGHAQDPPLLVLADLGGGPTLADRLLGDDAAAAERALADWATAVAELQAATLGLRAQFTAALDDGSRLQAPEPDTTSRRVRETVVALARDLPRIGFDLPEAAVAELHGVAEELDVSADGAPGALVPGDTCPDNAVYVGNRLVLLDFEGAEYRHLAWEAAYLTVPWPTCWCSWQIPNHARERALRSWRTTLAPASPVVYTDRFTDALAHATIGWAFISAGWMLARALDGDPPPPDPARRPLVPTRRALLQHRLADVAAMNTTVLPALRDLAAQTHAATIRQWGHHPLDLATAFR